jgi:hypothetical protein
LLSDDVPAPTLTTAHGSTITTPTLTTTLVSTIIASDGVSNDDFSNDDLSSLTNDNSSELQEDVTPVEAIVTKKSGGRKRGTTIQSKNDKEKAFKLATTVVATKYIALKASTKMCAKNVTRNTLNKLIIKTENEFGLTECSIKSGTVKSRIMSLNATGFAPQRISPVANIEPLILQWVILLADMGQPLTKTGIIALANEVIDDTIHSRCLSVFKQKR